MEIPVEEAMLKGFKVPVPCTLNVTVEEVALTPETVPLSKIIELLNAVVPDQAANLPIAPEPVIDPLPQEVV